MIYQLKELVAIEPILDLIKKRQDIFKIPIKKISDYLYGAVADKESIVLIDEKNKEIRGVLYGSIEQWNGEYVLFIHLCVVDPEQKNTTFEFLSRLNKWGKEKGLKKMIFSTERPKGFIRKYKFKQIGVVLSKQIGG